MYPLPVPGSPVVGTRAVRFISGPAAKLGKNWASLHLGVHRLHVLAYFHAPHETSVPLDLAVTCALFRYYIFTVHIFFSCLL